MKGKKGISKKYLALMAAAVAVGIVLAVIQHLWAVVPLPSEGYLLEAVPVALCWEWWLVAMVATMAITLVVMLLPAALAAKISPAKIMRYE